MTAAHPQTQLAQRFSSPDALPRPWEDARAERAKAQLYWVSTVRPEGRPHVTPLIGVWLDEALYFCTGPDERKARNLAENPHCVLTTGSNSLSEGLDVVVQGEAVIVHDHDTLQRVADACVAKYGPEWTFTVSDGAFIHERRGRAHLRGPPEAAFAFGKGEPFSQTRYRF